MQINKIVDLFLLKLKLIQIAIFLIFFFFFTYSSLLVSLILATWLNGISIFSGYLKPKLASRMGL